MQAGSLRHYCPITLGKQTNPWADHLPRRPPLQPATCLETDSLTLSDKGEGEEPLGAAISPVSSGVRGEGCGADHTASPCVWFEAAQEKWGSLAALCIGLGPKLGWLESLGPVSLSGTL